MTQKTIDLLHKKFGRLEVIALSDKRSKDRALMWVCRCDCGNITTVMGQNLRKGTTQSCGCLQRQLTSERSVKKFGTASFNNVFYKYKESARNRNLDFELTRDEFKALTQRNCHYCGIEPYKIKKEKTHFNGDYIYNGVDRLDSSRGYTLQNCVPCCSTCNYAKRTMSEDEFLSWIRRVYINSFAGELV